MNPKKKLWITLSAAAGCILLLLGILVFVLSVVKPRTQMQGFVVDYDGTVKEEVSFSIRTKQVRDAQKSEKELKMTFELPLNFSHQVDTLTTISLPSGQRSYYVLGGFCYGSDAIGSSFAYAAYDKDKGLLIIDWNDGNAEYFVATSDPDVTAQEILAYYKGFLESILKPK